MEPEKDLSPAANDASVKTEGIEVKSTVQPEEHAAYIAAVSENESVTEPTVVTNPVVQANESVEMTAESTQPADKSSSEVIQQDPEQTSSLEEIATVVEPVAAIPMQERISKRSRINGVLSAFKKSSRRKKLITLAIVLAVAGLLVFGMVKVFSDGKVSGLVSDSKNKIGFMRPENWQESKEEDGLTYYTENGIAEADVSRGMILGVQKLGIRYNSLTEDNKANIRKSFQDEFSSSESFSNDQCSEIGNVQTEELVREGYDLAFKVDADCTKLKNGNTGGTIKMFVGWSDVDLHVVGVVADNPTWNAEGSELDTILTSIKPE